MEWLYWLSINAQDYNHSGIQHRLNPFNLPDHPDHGPNIINPAFLGPNSVGNWICAAMLFAALLTALFGATKAGPVFGMLVILIIIAGIVISASGKFGYF